MRRRIQKSLNSLMEENNYLYVEVSFDFAPLEMVAIIFLFSKFFKGEK